MNFFIGVCVWTRGLPASVGPNPLGSLSIFLLKLSQIWLPGAPPAGSPSSWELGRRMHAPGLRAPPFPRLATRSPSSRRAGQTFSSGFSDVDHTSGSGGAGSSRRKGCLLHDPCLWSGAYAFILTDVFAVCRLGARLGDNQLFSDEDFRMEQEGGVDTAGHRASMPDLALLHGVGSWAWRCLQAFSNP